MHYQIKTIDELTLTDMPRLLQPFSACFNIRQALQYYNGRNGPGSQNLYHSNIRGLQLFIDRHFSAHQRHRFRIRYGRHNPYAEAVEAMINQGEAYLLSTWTHHLPLLIPPELQPEKDQHFDSVVTSCIDF